MRKWLWLVAFVLGFVGCDERDDPGLADSATSADAGSSVDDAGSLADARPLADADVTDGAIWKRSDPPPLRSLHRRSGSTFRSMCA